MYSNKIRVILVCVSLIIGALSLFAGIYLFSLLLLIGALLQIYGYFAYSGVWLAFKYIQKQDFAEAKNIIQKVNYPNLLNKKQKGYYHFILGNILLNEKNYESALLNFKNAIDIGLRTSNDLSISYFIIAQIYYYLEKHTEALIYINKAIDTPHKEGLNEVIVSLRIKIEDKL